MAQDIFEEAELGFKKLTPDNWLEPDVASVIFARFTPEGIQRLGPQDWAIRFLRPQLHAGVPLEIVRLFEAAKGVLLYGCFFYPLYVLGFQQLARVTETAVTSKCELLRGRGLKKMTFNSKIDWLVERQVIHPERQEWWAMIRRYRNESSHPQHQFADTPGSVASMLQGICDEISDLFDNEGLEDPS